MLWGGNIVSVPRLTGFFPEQTPCGKWTSDVVLVSVLRVNVWDVAVSTPAQLQLGLHYQMTVTVNSPWSNLLQHTTQGPMGKFHTPTSSQLQPLYVCCRPDTFWTWTSTADKVGKWFLPVRRTTLSSPYVLAFRRGANDSNCVTESCTNFRKSCFLPRNSINLWALGLHWLHPLWAYQATIQAPVSTKGKALMPKSKRNVDLAPSTLAKRLAKMADKSSACGGCRVVDEHLPMDTGRTQK